MEYEIPEEYKNLSEITISPDGKHLIYGAIKERKIYRKVVELE